MLDPRGTAGRLRGSLLLAALVASCTNGEPPSATPAPSWVQRSCQGSSTGFADPAAAFAAYAQAVNEHAWCRAANAFAREARPKLASMSFKGLALTAGSTDHPRRAPYLERFLALCTKYELHCDSEQRASELSANLLNGKPTASIEPRLVAISSSVPEDVYSDVMSILADVDPNAIRAIDPQLHDLTLQDNRATGLSKLLDGRANPMLFRKSIGGWTLDLR